MARIRSVHPALCVDESLVAVSARAERTFIRLWTHLDDEGRAVDNPKLLKAALYPLHDDMTATEVDLDLRELTAAGLVYRYQVAGKRYLTAKETWKDYQKPRHPVESKLPSPIEGEPLGTPSDEPPRGAPADKVPPTAVAVPQTADPEPPDAEALPTNVVIHNGTKSKNGRSAQVSGDPPQSYGGSPTDYGGPPHGGGVGGGDVGGGGDGGGENQNRVAHLPRDLQHARERRSLRLSAQLTNPTSTIEHAGGTR